MSNETMRIFFPLKIITSSQGEYGLDDNPIEITPIEAVAYEDAILAAIAKENRFFENDRGLAEYIYDKALNNKVYSLYPSVEIVDGELWGVMTAGLKEPISGEERSTGGRAIFTAGRPNSAGLSKTFPFFAVNGG